jgi:hypothetical protein
MLLRQSFSPTETPHHLGFWYRVGGQGSHTPQATGVPGGRSPLGSLCKREPRRALGESSKSPRRAPGGRAHRGGAIFTPSINIRIKL